MQWQAGDYTIYVSYTVHKSCSLLCMPRHRSDHGQGPETCKLFVDHSRRSIRRPLSWCTCGRPVPAWHRCQVEVRFKAFGGLPGLTGNFDRLYARRGGIWTLHSRFWVSVCVWFGFNLRVYFNAGVDPRLSCHLQKKEQSSLVVPTWEFQLCDCWISSFQSVLKYVYFFLMSL